MNRILKVKDWLKSKFRADGPPDTEGLSRHIQAWNEDGIPYEKKDLIRIAGAYGFNEINDIKVEGNTVFIHPSTSVSHVKLKFKILPTGTNFID